jgi:hypothetical protein
VFLLSAATAKHLIRTGANSARVAVTLWNTGANDGYRRETFGDRITIERRITPSGASKYRVLNAQGRVVSEKRDDMQVSIILTFSALSSTTGWSSSRRDHTPLLTYEDDVCSASKCQ